MGKENQATIYIKVGDVATYKIFQTVCDREGESVSEKIMKMIRDYVAGHGEGNPQTILDYAGEIMTLPKWKTCEFSQKMRVHGEIYCQPVRRRGYRPNWVPTTRCKKCKIYTPVKHIFEMEKEKIERHRVF